MKGRSRQPSSHERPRRVSPRPKQNGLWGKDTVSIDRMSQEGRGIATRAKKIVFVSGALPGEEVQVQCTAVKRDYDEAEITGLVAETAPSAHRVQPECPVYNQCGGCSLQHLAAPAQLQHKQDMLLESLRKVAPKLNLEPPILSRPRAFRHRLRLLVQRGTDRSYSLGLRQRGSHEGISLSHCLIANQAVNDLLRTLPDMLAAAPDLQGLREIEIDADSNNQLGLCFYFAAHPGEKNLSALRSVLLVGSVVALRVRLNTQRRKRSDAPHDEPGIDDSSNWQELYAEGELLLQLDSLIAQHDDSCQGLHLAYLPGDFTQTQWEVNAALVVRGIEWLQPGPKEHALDLFSGIGNFSLALAAAAKAVTAIEGDAAMAMRVVANAERNGIENVTAKVVNLMTEEVTLPRANIAIVDPPRAGAKSVCEALAHAKVRRLVYISCHPATLLRDARILQAAGYRLLKASAVDMFPHTGHSEAIALFERKSQ